MNNIDILEEKEKKAINNLNFIVVTDIYGNEVSIDKTKIINEYNESVGIVLNLVKTLMAENKELKERNKRQQENLKITNKKIAAQRGQLMMLNKAYIPKSKVEELIEEVKEDENPSISSFQEYAQEYAIDKLQSLLGKE